MTPSTWNQWKIHTGFYTPVHQYQHQFHFQSRQQARLHHPNPNKTGSPSELCNGRWSFDQVCQRNPRDSQWLAHLWTSTRHCWTTWESRVKAKKSIFRSGLVLWLCFQKKCEKIKANEFWHWTSMLSSHLQEGTLNVYLEPKWRLVWLEKAFICRLFKPPK